MIEIYPNQALGFSVQAASCGCGGNYCQPVIQTDLYKIQGRVSALCGSNLAVDPEFLYNSWGALGSGFAISGGALNYTGSVALTVAQPSTYTLGLTANRPYKIRFKVTVTDTGDCGADEGWWIKINGNFLKLPNVTLGGGSSESLETSLLYIPSSITSDIPTIGVNNKSIRFSVDYLYVEQFSIPSVFLRKNGVDGTPGGTVTFYPSTKKDLEYCTFHIDVDFSELSGGVNGCYIVKVCDSLWETVNIGTVYITGKNNVTNGSFDDAGTWNYGSGWSRVASGMGYKAQRAAGSSTGELTQQVTICGGIKYQLQFTLSGTAGLILQTSVRLGSELLGNFQGAGVQTAYIDLTDLTGPQTLTLGFSKGVASQNGDVIEIDDVTLTARDIEYQEDVCFESACINLQTSHDCTLLLGADNNDAAFGFDYSNGFEHSLRIKAKKDVTGYPEQAETYNYSNNDNDILYANTEKELSVFITDAPDYIHDCVRHLRLHDTFTIDGTEYIKVGSYELNRRKTSEHKQSVFTVKEKTGITPNYRLA